MAINLSHYTRVTYSSLANMNISFEVSKRPSNCLLRVSWLLCRVRLPELSSGWIQGCRYLTALSGTGISLYGDIGPTNSPFFITLDGSMPQVLTPNSGVNSSTAQPQLLFMKDGLERGNHTLVVRNNPAYTTQLGIRSALNIHHAEVLDSTGYNLRLHRLCRA